MRALRLASLLLFAAGAARAQSEGVAEFKGTMTLGAGKAIPSASKVYFTSSAYRMELEVDLSAITKGASAVPAHHKTITIQKFSDPDHPLAINEARRTYAISDLKAIRASVAGRKPPTYAVTKLGPDTVAGHSCVRALVTSSSGTESELCIATSLTAPSSWLSLGRKETSGTLLAALREKGLQGFPIRIVVRRPGKEVLSKMELVRFEKKSLPASLFEAPAGYTLTDEAFLNLTEEQEKMMKDLRAKMKARGKS